SSHHDGARHLTPPPRHLARGGDNQGEVGESIRRGRDRAAPGGCCARIAATAICPGIPSGCNQTDDHVVTPTEATMALTRPELEQFASKSRARFEELLKEFVEIPSVSAEPDRVHELERCAELGAATIRDFGGQAEIHRVPEGPPVVLGSFGSDPPRPTGTIYHPPGGRR